jgi:hypothetical protein
VTEVELIVRWSTRAWDWLEDTVADVTNAQANWWPPGTANSIGATYLHIVINTDVEINRLGRVGRVPRRRGRGGRRRPMRRAKMGRCSITSPSSAVT